MRIEPPDLARLRSYMSRGEVILFTGAGFSFGVNDRSGRGIPSSGELKGELWNLCYPGEPLDEGSSLGDLYGAALSRRKSELETLIRQRLTVDPDTLPKYFDNLFNVPWLRCYTLNIDDLESAVKRRTSMDRQPLSISARDPKFSQMPGLPLGNRGLEVVHLNGIVSDPVERLTFSETQYAERIGSQEPWDSRCVVDITARPVIFIGTALNEALLWQHMELRRRRENIGRDLRPTSILVTKNLSRPRTDILRDLRINWVQGTAEEFVNEILPELRSEIARGFAYIRERNEGASRGAVPLVSDLAAERPTLQTEYLLGEEPQWADILQGRAMERSHDKDLLSTAQSVLEGETPPTAIAVTGTAGTGKSTALMSLALKLTSGGVPVLWVDKTATATPARMRAQVRGAREKIVLAIDDADMYGRELTNLISDLVPRSQNFLFAFGMRSSKIDAITVALAGTPHLRIHEHIVPPLDDADIDGLIAVLEKNKRLGILTNELPAARRQAFRDQAGRQLLVAMIQATSGENFEKKAQAEYGELEGAQRFVYGLVAVASALRHTLTKDEVLLAYGDSHEQALAALERLEAHHLISSEPGVGAYRCRHRVIADLVFDKMRELGELNEAVAGLAWAMATKVGIPLDRTSRIGKCLVRLINHDFLINTVGTATARELYVRLEALLSGDYHFWLQRGSLEVEVGDVRRAENFLGSARSLGGDDFRVGTEYAYMLMRKAWESPLDLHAEDYLARGMSQLEEIIEDSGRQNEYPFHVYGSQGLAWARRAIANRENRRIFLTKLSDVVNQGLELHPISESLKKLSEDLKREILLTVATGV
jgi:hypothetical protein